MPVSINIHGETAAEVVHELAQLTDRLGLSGNKPAVEAVVTAPKPDAPAEPEKAAAKKPGPSKKKKAEETAKTVFMVTAPDGNTAEFDDEDGALEAFSELIRGAESLDYLDKIGNANSDLAEAFSDDAKKEAMDVFAEMRAELTPADEAEDPADADEEEADGTKEDSASEDGKPATLDDMKAKMVEFCDAFSFDDARKLLNAFGVEKGNEIPPEHFATVVQIVEKSIEGGKAPNFDKIAAAYGPKKEAA